MFALTQLLTLQIPLTKQISNSSSPSNTAPSSNSIKKGIVFFNSTAGQNPPNIAYRLFLCRGDVKSTNCRDCITTVRSEITTRCPNQKLAVIWYELCMLCYSNVSFSTVETNPAFHIWNTANMTDETRFLEVLVETMDKLANRASIDNPNDQFIKGFATQQVDFTVRHRKAKGSLLTPSCNVRFKIYPFYHELTTDTEAIYRFHFCPNTTTYIPNSTYQTNLNLLLSTLSSKSTNNGTVFSTSTAGQNPPDIAYGLFLCRGNIFNSMDCDDCVAIAKAEITTRCPNEKSAVLWYDECMLRYSNASFFTTVVGEPMIYLVNTAVITDEVTRFQQVLAETMDDLANRAPVDNFNYQFVKGFATQQAIVTSSQRLYGLVQCTHDLSEQDCNGCLQMAINRLPRCCSGRQGGRVCLQVVIKAKKNYDAVTDETSNIVQSLQFDLGRIQAATNNFSDENKIGEGGFGMVYKGTLTDGQEIAMKRLSKSSGQREEKIVIYEYVPNKSLDYFLFDPKKQGQLDWSRRYKIIEGIVRGILYLHEDSQLRIMHRDLKASNIFLNAEMNAKVSNFGMARIFGVDQTQGNTNRIVGTYGYMSPEYAMHEQFSMKSNMFSFGILVLEIITGKKNRCFYQSEYGEDLLSHACKSWKDGMSLELMDPTLSDAYSRNEVIRCIEMGLFYTVSVPMPEQPQPFFHSRTESHALKGPESDESKSKSATVSLDEPSITEVHPK
ncbi:hypothetical protein LguiB_012735 [Lonicera macranthoides]